jgi:hypothetical protein
MLWNGNECGIRLGDENVKVTNSNTDYDSFKTAGVGEIFLKCG